MNRHILGKNTRLLLHKDIQNDVSVDWIGSCFLEGDFSFLCYDYKTLLCSFTLEFLQQYLLVWSRSFKDMPYTYHLKDFNNHNTSFGTDLS